MPQITLTAADGAALSAYEAKPNGAVIGGLIVIQEIFGVNQHMREVADGYAAAGFHAIAPALYDRLAPGVELGYDDVGIKRGLDLRAGAVDTALTDIDATRSHLAKAGCSKIGAVGFCWGGSLVWRSAAQLNGLAAGVAYYGGEVPHLRDLTAQCPVMAHFGEQDASIPMDKVAAFIAAQPDVETHIYPADHGFNCGHRGQYDSAAAASARDRSLTFLRAHLTS